MTRNLDDVEAGIEHSDGIAGDEPPINRRNPFGGRSEHTCARCGFQLRNATDVVVVMMGD